MALKAQTSQITAEKRTGYYYQGKEIILTGSSGRPVKTKRHKPHWWPEDKKIEAATLWAVIKDKKRTAELTGVPVGTITKWVDEPWFKLIVDQVKKDKNEVLDAKITEALDETMEVILDRLKHGEYYPNRKTGELDRIPIKVRDISKIVGILFDKRQIIRGEPTSVTENISYEKKLETLKENFERLAKSVGINAKKEPIIGVEYAEESENAGPDERETSPEGYPKDPEHKKTKETIFEEEGSDVNAIEP